MPPPRFPDPRHPDSRLPTSARSPEQSGAYLLDISTARVQGEISWPKPSRGPRPAVDPNYLSRTRANDPWPEDRTHQEPCVRITRCAVATPSQDLLLNEPFALEVDIERLKKPSLRRVSITARCTFRRGDTEVTERPIAPLTVSLDPAQERQTLRVQAQLLGPGDYRHGERLRYTFEARHDEATNPCSSEPLEVRARTRAHWIELTEAHLPEGVLLAPSEELFAHLALARRFAREHGNHCIVAFAHAGEDGAEISTEGRAPSSSSRDLSRWRGKAIRSLLDQDARRWEALSKDLGEGKLRARSLQALLAGLTRLGWDCDCGAIDGVIGPKTEAAIRQFQGEANRRLGIALKTDGITGPKTWAAFHRALSVLLEEADAQTAPPGAAGASDETSTAEARTTSSSGSSGKTGSSAPALGWGYGESEGMYPCGADFAPGAGSEAKVHDRIDLLFFAPGCEPVLLPPPSQGQATIAQNPAEDREVILREKLGAPPRGTRVDPLPLRKLQVGLFFDGTWNNRANDLPKGCDTNVSKLYDLFDEDRQMRFRFYYEGVGSRQGLKSYLGYDAVAGGLTGWGAEDRIERASQHLRSVLNDHESLELELHIIGFSRGAATALSFINRLWDDPRQWLGRDQVPCPRVRFLGLFDAVGSFYRPGNEEEGHHDLRAHHSRIERLTHLVALHEQRELFPLTSIRLRQETELPEHWEERMFPGVHSDVGGGYGNEDYEKELAAWEQDVRQREETKSGAKHMPTSTHRPNPGQHRLYPRGLLSHVPLWAMYDAAVRHGVPMKRVEAKEPENGHHSPEWWHVAPESEKRQATWIKLQGQNPKLLDRMRIPPDLIELWRWRNHPDIVEKLLRPESEFYQQAIEPFRHESLYPWEPSSQARAILRRGERS